MKTELKIDSLAYQGYGVGRSEGKVWFVPYTCPGDTIYAEAVKEKKNFVHGRIVGLKTPSPRRIEPECALFGDCGGCHWQMVTYEDQINAKKLILEDTFRRSGLELPAPPEVRRSPSEWGYRNRIQMRTAPSGFPGFYRAESGEIIPIPACPLAEEQLNHKIAGLNEAVRKNPDSLSKKYPDGFELRMTGEGKTEIRSLSGKKNYSGEFSQVNSRVNLILRDEIRACLDEVDPEREDFRILDLYCGDGNLSLPLADRALKIAGWEGSKGAVKWGNRKAVELLRNDSRSDKSIEYRAGYLEKHRKDIERESRDSDILIIDPPRRGIKGLGDFIGGLGIENIFYVSCSPPNLARDLNNLKSFGYRIEKTVLLDMFPQTYHMEVLVRLEKS